MSVKRKAVWWVLRRLGRRAAWARPRSAQSSGARATVLPAPVELLLLRAWPYLDTPANRARATVLRDRIRAAAAGR